jgi:hypothetical protein
MNRLLLVGWDAADWKAIDPLLFTAQPESHADAVIVQEVRDELWEAAARC